MKKDYVEKMNESLTQSLFLSSHLNEDNIWESVKNTAIYTSKKYCSERASNRKLIFSQLEEAISKLEEKEQHSIMEQKVLERTKEDYDAFIQEKLNSIAFRLRCTWYNKSELPTQYFLNLEKAKSGARGMNTIKINGRLERDPAIILKEQRKFYQRLYTADESIIFDYQNNSGVKIAEKQKTFLDEPITKAELENALKSLKKGKAPGCDGLGPAWYVMFWKIIGDPLFNAIKYAYRIGRLHQSAVRGVTSLLPKKQKDTRLIQNLRPISLLNTDYKLLEKVLSIKMRSVLNTIIMEDQKGFLKDRTMSSNIRRVLSIIDYANSNDLPGVIVSVDFMKCFDMISTEALIEALKYFNFGPNFCKWTKILYTNTEACVANNGYISTFFNINRGTKQGGPNSAYYFLVIAEVLAIELRKASNISGFVLNQVRKVLGQYADDIDLYLFGHGQ